MPQNCPAANDDSPSAAVAGEIPCSTIIGESWLIAPPVVIPALNPSQVQTALKVLRARNPDFEVDGEMHGDVALDGEARKVVMPNSTLHGDANLLVLPNIDAANISYNLLKTAAGGGIAIGPVLLGANQPVHILTPSATVRRIVNMTALTVADANAAR